MLKLLAFVCASAALAWPQSTELKTAEAVFEKYKQALGGAVAIRKVQSETRHGEFEQSGMDGKATFISYSKPFKGLNKVKRPDGREITSGFDGKISWSIDDKGASIDDSNPLEATRRDADLQYVLHQAEYFQKIELAGVVDFEGRRCYWLHGTTHWGKDNNQYYDVETGLLAGYRFQADNSPSSAVVTLLFGLQELRRAIGVDQEHRAFRPTDADCDGQVDHLRSAAGFDVRIAAGREGAVEKVMTRACVSCRVLRSTPYNEEE